MDRFFEDFRFSCVPQFYVLRHPCGYSAPCRERARRMVRALDYLILRRKRQGLPV